MRLRVLPGSARGTVAAPPSKSMAHRLLIASALAGGESRWTGIAESEDIRATLEGLRALGAAWVQEGDALRVRGGRPHPGAEAIFPCRESGSTLRFLLPLAVLGEEPVRFTGSPRLMERGVSVYEAAWAEKGPLLTRTASGLRARGPLVAGAYALPGDVSSQFVSGMLFALPLCRGDSILTVRPPVESAGYIRMTLETLRAFAIRIEETAPYIYGIPGDQTYQPRDGAVEGDWSNAAPFLALNALGGQVTVTGLEEDSLQGDRAIRRLLARLETPGAVIDLADCPDLGPLLMTVAALKQGATFLHTRRLAWKESDRVRALLEELAKLGVRGKEETDRVTVFPGPLHPPTEPLAGHHDHRIVMALAVAASRFGGEIEGTEAVAKSFPDFWTRFAAVGIRTEKVGEAVCLECD